MRAVVHHIMLHNSGWLGVNEVCWCDVLLCSYLNDETLLLFNSFCSCFHGSGLPLK